MSLEITTAVNERSTKAFICAFTDEDGDAVTPDTLVWTLTDLDGTVINDREQEEASPSSSSVTIVLSGADLQILATEEDQPIAYRYLIVEATYTSSLGSSLPLTEEVLFPVNNLHYVGTS